MFIPNLREFLLNSVHTHTPLASTKLSNEIHFSDSVFTLLVDHCALFELSNAFF